MAIYCSNQAVSVVTNEKFNEHRFNFYSENRSGGFCKACMRTFEKDKLVTL